VKRLFQPAWSALRDAGWAPALVLLLRALLLQWGVREHYDPLIHFSGGVAIAYFFYRLIRIFSEWLGNLAPAGRLLLAYTCACTTALFWEFGEWGSDKLTGGHIQHSVFETLFDLLYGALGAFCALALIAAVKRLRAR
jgi:hypothetical protein